MNGFFRKGIFHDLSFKSFSIYFILRTKQCPDQSSSPATLRVHNMLGKKNYFSLFPY